MSDMSTSTKKSGATSSVMFGLRRVPNAKPGDTFSELRPLLRRHFPDLDADKRRMLAAEFVTVRFGGLILVNTDIAMRTIERLKRATSRSCEFGDAEQSADVDRNEVPAE